MGKVRDYGAKRRALNDKAAALSARMAEQLGQLITATGAGALDLDVLVGGLLHIAEQSQIAEKREAWRTDGAAFVRQRLHKNTAEAAIDRPAAEAEPGGDGLGVSSGAS